MAGERVLETVVDISGSIDPSLQRSINGVNNNLQSVNLKALAVGAAMGGIAIATGKAVLSAGKHMAKFGEEYKKTLNQISAATGAAGEEMAYLEDTLKNVYASGRGEDMADVAQGLITVRQVLGGAGGDFEEATKAAFVLADTFEFEISESARAASSMMNNFGVTAEEAYGLIALGAQNGADKNGDLLDSLNEYSNQYAALGLNADQFVGSLIAGAETGMWSIDKVGDAVKEFNIRAKDESAGSAEAFQALGYNADEMFAAFAAGGDAAQTAFFDVVNTLADLEDPLLKNQTAVALFGTQFEDLEADVLPMLANIQDASYDGAEALGQLSKVKYDNIGQAFEQIKRSAEVAFLPMATLIANTLSTLMPTIQSLFETIIPVIESVMEACMPFVEEFLLGMGDVLKQVAPMLSRLAAALLPMLTQLMSNLLPPILALIEAFLPPFMQIVEALMPPLMSILMAVLPLLTQIANMILPVLADMMVQFLPILTPLLMLAAQLLNDIVLPILPPLIELMQTIFPVIAGLLSGFLPLLTPLLSLLSPLASILGTIVGWLAKIVGWVGQGMSWIVDVVTGKSSPPADLPAYATGGFTSGLSLAGEDPRYPTEAVLSFNPAYRQQNLSYWAKAGQMLGAIDGSGNLLSSNTGGNVVYDLGGVTFSPVIQVSGEADEETIIKALKRAQPEFMDLVVEGLRRREDGVYVPADNWVL